MNCLFFLLTAPSFILPPPGVVDSDDVGEQARIASLRSDVLKTVLDARDRSASTAISYKRLFKYVGLKNLNSLTNDADSSVALQAAWEANKKLLKRDPPIAGRTEWVMAPEPIKEFLAVFAKRLKAEPPKWWCEQLTQGEVFPGKHHLFSRRGVKVQRPEAMYENGDVIIKASSGSIRLSNKNFKDEFGNSPLPATLAALWGPEQSLVAAPPNEGYPYDIVAFETISGKKLWTAHVWAVRRGPFRGRSETSPTEILRTGEMIMVYGSGGFGMYAEGFDAKTGKCVFRFCTSYWFDFSEKWDLK